MNSIKSIRDKLNAPLDGLVFFLNPFTYLILRNYPGVLEKANAIRFDGVLLCKIFKVLGFENVRRESFDNTSLAPVVFESACTENQRVAIIGSEPDVIAKFMEYLGDHYNGLNVVYYRNGYFDNEEDIHSSHEALIKLRVDLVIVGMGAGKQEEYLVGLKDKSWNGVAFTCGGFIHQTVSNGFDYYPGWVNKYNLRFLYRIYDEPYLLKRYMIRYPQFVIVFIKDVISYLKDRG